MNIPTFPTDRDKSASVETLYLAPLRAYQRPVLYSTARDDFTVSVPQAGKTVTGAQWLLAASWIAGKIPWPWWWAAPTYDLTKAGYDVYCEAAASAGILKSHTTRPPLVARLINGAKVEGRSWHEAKNLRGHPIAGAVVDEFGLLTSEAGINLSARRLETINYGLGFYRYLGNVGEIGGYGEKLWRMAENSPGCARRSWTWRDRARELICECASNGAPAGIEPELGTSGRHRENCGRRVYTAFVEAEADRMSRGQFLQTYEAEWLEFSERPVYEFTRAANVDEDLILDQLLPLDLTCDFNVDPLAWTVGQHHADRAWTLDEIAVQGGGGVTLAACRELIRRYPEKRTSVHVYGDASGNSRQTSATLTDYDTIRSELSGYYGQVEIRVPAANPGVIDRVNAVNALLLSASGLTRYLVHPRCENTIRDLARTSYRQGTREIDKRDKTMTHWSDSIGYRLAYLYPATGPTIISIPTADDRANTLGLDAMRGAEF